MKDEKRRERLAVRNVANSVDLILRSGGSRGYHGGRFTYVRRDAPGTKRWVSFDWDGAGFQSNGGLVLLEAELNGDLHANHIQNHIARLPVMLANGDRVMRLIWIIRPSRRRQLVEILQNWTAFFEPTSMIRLPPMEMRSPDGGLIPW